MGHSKASPPQGTGVAAVTPQPVDNDQPPFQGSELTQMAPGQLVGDQVVGDPVCPPGAEAKLEDQTSRLPFVRLMAAYLCLCACYFTSFLDSNAVATALPTMGASLGAGPSITWAGTAYLLGQTAFQPLHGRLSDIVGRKPVLLAAVGCLLAGGLLCGGAQSPAWLYAARALGGVGAGGVSTLAAVVVSDLVSLRDRGKYQGLINIAVGAGAMAGPFVAAALLRRRPDDADDDAWRWVFWVPAALAAACLVLVALLLPLKPVAGPWQAKLLKIDWPGLVASVSGIVLLLVPISSGGSIWPWRSAYVIPMIITGGLCLIAFALYEGYWAKLPMMPWRLFQRRSPAILLVQGALHDFVWQTGQYFIPLYLQTVRGYTPLRSATLVLPFLLAQCIAGVSSGPIMTKLARYGPVLRIGLLLWLIGAGLKLMFSRTTPLPAYVIALAVEGAGVGFVHQPGLVALQALSRQEDRAVATSARNLLRSLGGVAGVAISTAVQNAVTKTALRARLPADLALAVMDGKWRSDDAATAGYGDAILDARMKGFRAVFALLVPLMALCFLGSFFVSDEVLKGDTKETSNCRRRP